ncbi:MAG: hypothetical protein HY097_08915 [Nitrospinae bacterium]|nr:hypothetical protein [Nitrospinota bacterium]MBI3813027.1 hypothetical protein [Nitrospinota bacterium]
MKLFEIPIYYKCREKALRTKYWRSYDYNEVVGWLVLEPRLNAIRAEYWFVMQRPCENLVRKQFECRGKLFQIRIRGLENPQICDKLHRTFLDMQTNSHLSKYYFDLQAFEAIAPYVDWCSAIRFFNNTPAQSGVLNER